MNLSLVRGCLTSLAGLPTHLAAYIPLFRVRTEGKLIDLFFWLAPEPVLVGDGRLAGAVLAGEVVVEFGG